MQSLKMMTHQMSNGLTCGLPDNHNGQHRSPESLQRIRITNKHYNRFYRMTAKGILAGMRHNAKRRGSQ